MGPEILIAFAFPGFFNALGGLFVALAAGAVLLGLCVACPWVGGVGLFLVVMEVFSRYTSRKDRFPCKCLRVQITIPASHDFRSERDFPSIEQLKAYLPPGEDWVLADTRVVKDTRRDVLHTVLSGRRTLVAEVDFVAARNLPGAQGPMPPGSTTPH